MTWQKITVSCNSDIVDIVSEILIDLGSEGTSIVDVKDIKEVLSSKLNWDYYDDEIYEGFSECAEVSGYFGDKAIIENIQTELEKLRKNSEFPVGSLEINICEIDSEDWENTWKKYYAPIEIGKIVVVPKWIREYNREKLPIFIDPGMAFGTGSHETTAMCLRLLQKIDLAGKNVVDIGCGSGILGLATLKLGAKNCHFVDIDDNAIEQARQNLTYNECIDKAKLHCGDLLDCVEDKFDVALANITADILLRLNNDIGKVIGKYGYIVLSGLINARADEVMRAYSEHFTLLDRAYDGEWQAMMFINGKPATK